MEQQVVKILFTVSQISYIVAGIAAAVAVFLWFKLKIPAVIGDLSGRTARKSIAKTRAHNEKSGGKGYQPSATNVKRGTLTDTMGMAEKKRGSTEKIRHKKPDTAEQLETGLLKESSDMEVTGLLNETDETVALSGETSLLLDPDATVPLLNQEHVPVQRTGGKKIELLEEIILIHTQEQIV